MEERTSTLLADIEVEKQKKVEKAFGKTQPEVKPQPAKQQKTINLFSASAFPENITISKNETENEVVQDEETILENKIISEYRAKNEEINNKNVKNETKSVANDSSIVIEKPNYDMLETLSDENRVKIFGDGKEEEKEKAKPKKNVFKWVMLSIMFGLFGVWGIVNVAQINSVSHEITEVSTKYSVNYLSYLNNLHNLDATNSNNMENLFETINEEGSGVTNITEQSNWFDRFCNFIGCLFGG